MFMKEAASERSQIATEYATVQRQLDAARAELLALKTRCAYHHHCTIIAVIGQPVCCIRSKHHYVYVSALCIKFEKAHQRGP